MLHIIHLSDLHLSGEALVDAPKKTAKRQILDNLELALQDTKRGHPGDTWLVAITGDIFDTATLGRDEVQAVLNLLWDKLNAALGQPSVVLLPGNHDARAKGISKCRSWWPRNNVIPALRAHVDKALQPHVSLYAKQGPQLVWPVQDDKGPAHLVAYDSTYLPYGQLSAGGMVRTQDLLSLFPRVQDTRKPLVLMLHHHLIPTPVADFSLVAYPFRVPLKWLASNADYEEVMQTALGAGSALSTLQSLGRPVLVLHGHKHYPCVRLLSGTPDANAVGAAGVPSAVSSGTRDASSPGVTDARAADVLILAAGSAGLAEQYRPGHTSPLSIWPSFNHIQIDERGLQADCVAYPYRWNARPQDLSRRRLADMLYTERVWQPRDLASDHGSEPDSDSNRRLALNQSVVTIGEGTAGLAGSRRSFRVERTLAVGPRGQLASYREGVDCAKDATIHALPAVQGSGRKAAKLSHEPSLGVILPVGTPAVYEVSNGLYVSSADFAAAYDEREAPFESVELLNRYHADVAKLSVCDLLSQYKLKPEDCFASLIDLTLGIERPVRVTWRKDEDRADIAIESCPSRHRLRLYWPLKSCESTSVLRRCWLAIRRSCWDAATHGQSGV